MSAGKLLIIDDDEVLVDLVSQYLAKNGWTVLFANTPDAGLQILRDEKPRLVILDVMLPERDGFQVCREIRAFSDVPIIMLTARGDVTDRVVGLEMGADDYLSKPFEARELQARIQSILRRFAAPTKAAGEEVLRFGALRVDCFKRLATLRGAPVDLTTSEFDVLALFAKNPGQTLSRNEITDRLKGVDWQTVDRSVDVLMSRIRQKLGDDPKRPTYFKTVWGSGYVFIAKSGE